MLNLSPKAFSSRHMLEIWSCILVIEMVTGQDFMRLHKTSLHFKADGFELQLYHPETSSRIAIERPYLQSANEDKLDIEYISNHGPLGRPTGEERKEPVLLTVVSYVGWCEMVSDDWSMISLE
jgi:hypothetical protein